MEIITGVERRRRWRAEYGGLKLDQVKRLKALEAENARLRRRSLISRWRSRF